MYAGLLMIVVVLGIILGPWPDWWSIYLPPSAGAAFRLREVSYLVRFYPCQSGAVRNWKIIRTNPGAASWFRAVAVEALTPSAMVYGLVGLQETDSVRYRERILRLRPHQLADTIQVVDSMSVHVMDLRALLPDIERGTLRHIWLNPTQLPECD